MEAEKLRSEATISLGPDFILQFKTCETFLSLLWPNPDFSLRTQLHCARMRPKIKTEEQERPRRIRWSLNDRCGNYPQGMLDKCPLESMPCTCPS